MKTLHSLLAITLFLITFSSLQAQRQYETWYFGVNAGLSFAGGGPTPLLNGQINTIDGSAVISRPTTGDLLFYSDGAKVWDSSHSLMPAGTGLAGHESSGQPALIVPRPGDTNLFYIFTTGAANTASSATRYSVVDMRANGGRGDVIEKNSLLLENGTEKITATRHCNGVDYWVIAHDWGGNDFYAYLVTANGITDTVKSSIGETYPGVGDIQGTFQMSTSGRLLAVSSPALKAIEVFDFNNTNGKITNQRLLGKGDVDYYGLEFSPDNSRLYVNTLPFNNAPAYLYQFNLDAGDVMAIRASRYQYVELREGSWQGGQLQLGKDGRIYISWTGRDSLGVIRNPNLLAGAAQYVHNGLWLGGRITSYGLPNIIDSDLGISGQQPSSVTTALTMRPSKARPGDTVELVIVVCNDGSDDLLNIQLDLEIDPSLIPINTGSGQYTLSAASAFGCDSFSVVVRIPESATPGTVYRSCVDFLDAIPSPCALPPTSCGELQVEAPPIDVSEFDYTFHFPAACPGTTDLVNVLFNSRRYTDTINRVTFSGEQAELFAYGGATPVHFLIRPTVDQHIPVVVRRRSPGRISTIMVLTTVNQDTFRIRLIADVKASTNPFLDVSEIRTGNHSTTFDTCLSVTNLKSQTIAVIDTVWLRSGSNARLISPEIPFTIDPGSSRDLCFRIESPGPSRGDTLVLGGSENVEFCPHCFHHTLVINSLMPQPSSSVADGDRAMQSIRATVHPNPVHNNLNVKINVERTGSLSLELIDLTGSSRSSARLERVEPGRHTINLDCTHLPAGAYFLRVVSGDSEAFERVNIVR